MRSGSDRCKKGDGGKGKGLEGRGRVCASAGIGDINEKHCSKCCKHKFIALVRPLLLLQQENIACSTTMCKLEIILFIVVICRHIFECGTFIVSLVSE